MNRSAIRVVKVGGSLLDMNDLANRLRKWLAVQTPAHHVLLVGGGALVEQVRRWHAEQPLSESAAHWMCVDLMTVTAHLLHDRLPEFTLVEDDRLLCQRVGQRNCTIFSPARWLRHSEPHLPGLKLPANWEVTSDSIAARLAIVLQADELLLLKSALPNPGEKVQQWTSGGFVDQFFPALSSDLPPTRIVNLRDLPHRTMELLLNQ